MKAFHELINQSLPGTMVQHLYSLNGGEGWLAGLAVREDPAILASLSKRVDIRSRGALIQVERVHNSWRWKPLRFNDWISSMQQPPSFAKKALAT